MIQILNEGYQFMLMGWPFFTKDIGLNDRRKLGMNVEKGKDWRQGNMYVEKGMEEIVCLKKEMGLREEEEREFDESVLLCLR